MLIDAFSFFNELEVLDIRLNYLNDVVDKYVLLESNITYSGDVKPYYFDENKEKFKELLPKIEHFIVDDLTPPGPHPLGPRWVPENNQRRALKDALLTLNLEDDDWIIMGDLDEIPDKKLLNEKPGIFKMDSFLYYLNLLSDDNVSTCTYMQWKDMKNRDFQEIRNTRHGMPNKIGGWHFSWQGGLDRVRHKLKSFAHSELDTPEVHAKLEGLFNKRTSFFFNGCTPVSPIKIDEYFPEYLVKNQDKFKHMIYPVE